MNLMSQKMAGGGQEFFNLRVIKTWGGTGQEGKQILKKKKLTAIKIKGGGIKALLARP